MTAEPNPPSDASIPNAFDRQSLFYLPSERTLNHVPNQGWGVKTIIKASNIPGAGNGRFASEDVPKNKRIVSKPIVEMTKFISLQSISHNAVVVFQNKGEVENFVKLYSEEGQSRKDTIDCLAHFIWSLNSIEGAALCFSTWSMNHGDPGQGENVRFFTENGTLVGVTCVDIKAGEELLNDYRDFDLPNFWVDFCAEEGVKDVITSLKASVEL